MLLNAHELHTDVYSTAVLIQKRSKDMTAIKSRACMDNPASVVKAQSGVSVLSLLGTQS